MDRMRTVEPPMVNQSRIWSKWAVASGIFTVLPVLFFAIYVYTVKNSSYANTADQPEVFSKFLFVEALCLLIGLVIGIIGIVLTYRNRQHGLWLCIVGTILSIKWGCMVGFAYLVKLASAEM